MKVAMVSSAHVHASSYASILKSNSKFEFIGIWDDNIERGKSFAKNFEIPFYENLNEMLQKSEAVVITSENAKHLDHFRLVAGKVKGVLCEKPLATSIKDASEMLKIAEASSTKLGVAFPVRFHPVSQRVKEIFNEGEFGKALIITSSNRGKLPPGWFTDPKLSGGGAITDHVVHLVDLFRWFTENEFISVETFLGNNIHKDLKVEDCAILSLKLGDTPMTLDCSWAMPKSHPYWGEVKFRIIFEKGVVEADVFSQNIVFESNRSKEVEFINYGQNADENMLVAFAEWIEGIREDFPTAIDGLQATKVVEKAYESIEKGGVVVING